MKDEKNYNEFKFNENNVKEIICNLEHIFVKKNAKIFIEVDKVQREIKQDEFALFYLNPKGIFRIMTNQDQENFTTALMYFKMLEWEKDKLFEFLEKRFKGAINEDIVIGILTHMSENNKKYYNKLLERYKAVDLKDLIKKSKVDFYDLKFFIELSFIDNEENTLDEKEKKDE